MKRRTSSSKTLPTVSTSSNTQEPLAKTEEIEDPKVTTRGDSDATKTVGIAPIEVLDSAPLLTSDKHLVEVDDNDDDEALLPMPTNTSGITDEKARLLLQKYGLRYEPRARRQDVSEPPGKTRRVEKPVRIRIHWHCHECNSRFARDRTCVSCGHRRCSECIRSPPKKVRQVMEGTSETDHERGQAERPVSAVIAQEQPATSVVSGTLADEPAMTTLPRQTPETVSPSQSYERTAGQTHDETQSSDRYNLVMYSRPRSGEDLILRPRTQIMRRQCHQCGTSFLPNSGSNCHTCQHTCCTLCPRYPAESQKWPMSSLSNERAPGEEVRMVRAVQRVYKKPRQRVRYICDSCQTVFVDAERCRTCGHERCQECSRHP